MYVCQGVLLIVFFLAWWGSGYTRGVKSPASGISCWAAGCRALADRVCVWHHYFSGVVFIGYAGQFGWAYGVAGTGSA
jgi:SSS family solute:Na+ symporter